MAIMHIPRDMKLDKITTVELIKWVRENVKDYKGEVIGLVVGKSVAELIKSAYQAGRDSVEF